VSPNERNEPRGPNGSTLERLASSDDECEHLRVSLAEWGEQAPPFGQLPKERFWNVRRASGDENSVVGSVLAPSERAIAGEKRHVPRPSGAYRQPRGLQQWSDALDREYLRGEVREQHRLIPRSRADLEDALGAAEFEDLQVPCVRARL